MILKESLPASLPSLWVQSDTGADTLHLSGTFALHTLALPDAIVHGDVPPPFAVLLTHRIAPTAEAIRSRGDALRHVPLLAMSTPDQAAGTAPEIDEWLPAEAGPAATARRIAAWRPSHSDAPDRFRAMFDEREIADICRRFRDELVAALAVVDRAAMAVVGHRIAGIAGVLGYTGLGTLWRQAPDGDDATLRRETRKIIFAISLGEDR